jgi:ribosomal protein S18 acetylase RimI-like enzyme
MDRPHLQDLPDALPAAPFRLRTYEPGDEAAWFAIHEVADPFNAFSADSFWDQFGTDRELLRQRQFYLVDGSGTPIGTASAWFQANDPDLGRIHWVAIRPEFQGQGLAKPLLAAVCHRLRELGHTRAYLTTSTSRVPAICLYHAFGFRPNLDGTGRQQDWRDFLARTENEPRAAAVRDFLVTTLASS